ncbi:NACHT, LRR and PYD domains-containing protein 12-like isoform X2 [Clupea harengus]|uniref:NACHT, LRR and PYD domains-containing protein 12-like isoform X2 n=1 Tax=Clupea harengus TaxID=7950 RepID=A0A6P3VWF8_CLUHA|nr:NACHT, LRR and PYD domains-containing protein 12-like isoform X2 [Clupea harengus]
MSVSGEDGLKKDSGSHQIQTSESPSASHVSVKNDSSMTVTDAPNFSALKLLGPAPETHRPVSPVPSCVSLKSDKSIVGPPNFSCGPALPDSSGSVHQSRCGVCEKVLSDLVVTTCGHSICRQCIHSHGNQPRLPADYACLQCGKKSRVELPLQCFVDEHPAMEDGGADDDMKRILLNHKDNLKRRYECISEGVIKSGTKTLLNKIYTELFVTEGESEGVNNEHEVWQVEITSKEQTADIKISCNDIFKPSFGQEKHIKVMMTKGIAGIGKTVSVQKFILDWSEGVANHDIDLIFALPFRELNLVKDKQYSLHELLLDFYPELNELKGREDYTNCQVVFIFDGLDESRLDLNFQQNLKLSHVKQTSSVDVLMTSLIGGTLLPSALIWITSRPAATSRIPAQCIDQVTEVRGFSDPQKEEYFKKRVSDESEANNIISQIKTTRSLHIMCHIPVFCWIAATVLQQMLQQDDSKKIPKTLTEMFVHFLLIQTSTTNQKYQKGIARDGQTQKLPKEIILKLAELAFKQLEEGNLMFYEEDLWSCGIDVNEASVYSGMCTEIFKEESVFQQRKIYCFVHLSIQEFLAALYVFHSYTIRKLDASASFLKHRDWSGSCPLHVLLKSAVDEALKSKNGHLDLFLRFLMGISLESNQNVLKDLLSNTYSSSESIKKTCQYIKVLKRKDLSPERCINLFHCLFEMKDHSMHDEVQEYLKSPTDFKDELSPAHCSALAHVLLMSEEVLDEFDLKKYNASDEGRKRLVPAVRCCRSVQLAGCRLTQMSCEIVASALQTTNSPLRELNLCYNDLQKSSEKILSGLLSAHCKLETLKLAGCVLSYKSCGILASVLQSENCLLTKLDLSNNDLQDSGVQLLSKGLRSPNCKLQILRLAGCELSYKSCEILAAVLQSENCLLTELDLSNNDLQDSGVQLLSKGLRSPYCKLQILRLSGCLISEEGCGYLASSLNSNYSSLKELDLSYNHPEESGLRLLSARLEESHHKLNRLHVDYCAEGRIRPGLLKYACELTLDPNTANRYLSLSEGDRKVTRVREEQPYPDHSERIDYWYQVLCKDTLSGRCYWEVEWHGQKAHMGVAYKSIDRKDRSGDCKLGCNEKSWSLVCSGGNYFVRHKNKLTATPGPSSSRVGLYLDWPAGTLSFYSVSPDAVTHLYTFHNKFTEPICPGFKLWYPDSSVSLCLIT